jgi:hypothetical protein
VFAIAVKANDLVMVLVVAVTMVVVEEEISL